MRRANILAGNWRAGRSPLLLLASTCALAFMLSGCMVGSDYKRPEASVSGQYKVAGLQPAPPPSEWWRGFHDRELSRYILSGTESSPTLQAALARVDRAAAEAGAVRSELFPQIDFFSSALRERTGGADRGDRESAEAEYRSRYRGGLDLAWELDLWGRLRRLEASARAEAEAEAAAYAGSQVLLQTSIGRAYFRVRTLDERIRILELAIQGRKEQRDIIDIRAKNELANQLEAAQANTQWAIAKAGMESLLRARIQAENSLSVLTGSDPSSFQMDQDYDWEAPRVDIPASVPSDLLRRRPDITEAERLVAAASERVGARIAEYFPSVRLSGQSGFSASDLSDWFESSGFFGLIEPSVSLPLFNAGRTAKRVEIARAEYRELVAAYREQVLQAIREVEDALAAVRHIKQEITTQKVAVESADKASRLARERFDSGLVNYLEVVDTERVALDTALRLAELEGELLDAAIELARSLGGGWEAR